MTDEESERYPLATIKAINFSLASSKEIRKMSAFSSEGITQGNMLNSPALGLPTKNGGRKCDKCGTTNTFQCDGHFGHINLPFPIYHPCHVKFVNKILSKICLNCLRPRKSNLKKSKVSLESTVPICEVNDDDMSLKCHSATVDVTASVSLDNPNLPPPFCNVNIDSKSKSESSFIKIKGEAGEGLADTGRALQETPSCELGPSSSTSSKMPKGKVKARSNSKYVEAKSIKKNQGCVYCKPNTEYPALTLKVPGKSEGTKLIVMSINRRTEVISEYWDFMKKYDGFNACDSLWSRTLLPFEALMILKKIPEKTLKQIGQDTSTFKADALVLESIPVPPNCTRIHELLGDNTKFVDLRNTYLRKLVNHVQGINRLKMEFTFDENMMESRQFQSLFRQIIEGPKVEGNKAPITIWGKNSVDSSLSSLTLEKIRGLFMSKFSGLSSRSVIIGDAYIGIGEIGIPAEIARKVTFEERVTKFNRDELQKVVDKQQCNTIFTKDGKFVTEVMRTSKRVEIGELVNRSLRDGDIVFINRQPSLHKHSLLALKVFLHPGRSMVINPLICTPLGADFDGDCLHTYYPKSFQSKAELAEILSVDKQIFNSHNGEANILFTVDTLLSFNLIFKSFFIDKETMEQFAILTDGIVPHPAVLRRAEGAYLPFWTTGQLLEMALGINMTYDGVFTSIKEGTVIKFNVGMKEHVKLISEILKEVLKHKGSEAVLKFLHSMQRVLTEWISYRGYSFSLEDMALNLNSSGKSLSKTQLQKELLEIGKLLHYMGCGSYDNDILSQVQSNLSDTCNSITKELICKKNMLPIIENGGSKLVNKLVQQVGFVGLQLFHGKGAIPQTWRRRLSVYLPCNNSDAFDASIEMGIPETFGLITSSFVTGLTPSEAFIHSVACREVILCQKMGLKDPGILFKNLMSLLRDLTFCYDGTVRNACGGFVVQFTYGNSESNEKLEGFLETGDPVGAIAATAIAAPAYKGLAESAQMGISPWEIMEQTLKCSLKGHLKMHDRMAIIYLKDNNCVKAMRKGKVQGMRSSHEECQEMMAAAIQEGLNKVLLGHFAVGMLIEYQENWIDAEIKSPFLGHIKLDVRQLKDARLTAIELVQALFCSIRKPSHLLHTLVEDLILQVCETCKISNNCEGGLMLPCLHFTLRGNESGMTKADSHSFDDIFTTLLKVLHPTLMGTPVKGNDQIEAINISSSNKNANNWVSRKSTNIHNSRDIVLETVVSDKRVMERGDVWRTITNSFVPYIELLDDERCVPYNIQEAFSVLGVTAAFSLIVQRLSFALEMVGKDIFKKHLLLVADCMTFTGKVIGFNPAGYRAFYHSSKFPVPFTESTLKAPIKCLERAAEEGVTDTLSGCAASCAWGKRAPIGTGSNFELLWQDAEQDKQMDAFECIETLGVQLNVEDMMSGLSLCPDIDDALQEKNIYKYKKTPPHNFKLQTSRDKRMSNTGISGKISESNSETVGTQNIQGQLWETQNSVEKDNTNGEGWIGNTNDSWPVSNSNEANTDNWPSSSWECFNDRPCNSWATENVNATVNSNNDKTPDGWGSGNGNVNVDKPIDIPNDYDPNPPSGWESANKKVSVNKSMDAPNDYDQDRDGWTGNDFQNDRTRQPDTWSMNNTCPGSKQVEDSSNVGWNSDEVHKEQHYRRKSGSGSSGFTATGDNVDPFPTEGLSRCPLSVVEEESEKNENDFLKHDTSANTFNCTVDDWSSTRIVSSERGEKSTRKRGMRGRGYAAGRSNWQFTLRARSDLLVLDEDAILSEIEPLMQSMRRILHDTRYAEGAELSLEDKREVENVLSYHPQKDEKIGEGIAWMTVDYHANHHSRCFHIARKDGTRTDFSYLKCIKNLVCCKYPQSAEAFLQKYFN